MDKRPLDRIGLIPNFRGLCWLLLLYGVFLVGFQGWRVWQGWMRPVASSGPGQVVVVPPGAAFSEVARELENRGLIRSRYAFTVLAWQWGVLDKVQAGEYRFFPSQTPRRILSDLVEGRVLQHVITIPEGYNLFQVADLLHRAGLVDPADFVEACEDELLLRRLGIPGPSAEGYLYPDTYYLSRGMSARELVRHFVRRFWETWTREGFDQRALEMGMDTHDVVILASIVEKETSLPGERPLIAGVFLNRLRRGMPLQADPTVYYGILVESSVRKRRLRKADLRRGTPYNTYVVSGLPAGPISNPGRESIRAVLYPAKTNYLYFVAKNDGSHHFSRTLAEHNRAVDRYQRHRRRRR
ncbi:endolytic transglycosylase MltG [Dissulfurirhabdus thermomarina]|uniref:Endolytic murein transglycosylase n=1 Tax=Dissulfurirhabdus thermomarina TaxID=1765737 RepID=A0A6N9TQF8_DISTH|nr:endolytic transglycosylase MltG [Dissulfurirhabdus thermomarina]NDY42343.1 endolytic transglycosylase MltG [Dissulfurirhabdus thermomarina]NMX24221.1 endolytic transglycosylase MltG [Dissulfurirhabdus thermomarina]